jgi:DNA-directed RNA polymerase subunit RPC12/RpoP
MPVRFRCIYCNQLLGIARRKAGAIVHCTKCHGKIIVPNPDDPRPAPAAVGTSAQKAAQGSGSHLFERSDFDVLLRQEPDLPNDQFRFDDPSEIGLLDPSERSDTDRLQFLDNPPSLLPEQVWLVVLAAIGLAIVFFGLGYWVAKITA